MRRIALLLLAVDGDGHVAHLPELVGDERGAVGVEEDGDGLLVSARHTGALYRIDRFVVQLEQACVFDDAVAVVAPGRLEDTDRGVGMAVIAQLVEGGLAARLDRGPRRASPSSSRPSSRPRTPATIRSSSRAG